MLSTSIILVLWDDIISFRISKLNPSCVQIENNVTNLFFFDHDKKSVTPNAYFGALSIKAVLYSCSAGVIVASVADAGVVIGPAALEFKS